MQAARGASLSSSGSVTGEAPRRRLAHQGLFALVALAAYGLDLSSKQWALGALRERDIALLGDWFVLHLTFNPGAAFSTGTRFTIVFTCLAVVAILVVLWLARRLGSTLWAVGLGLLLGGVAGNLTDRLVRDPAPLRGHVVDFLMVPHWPVFNVADVCINVAAGVIVLQTLRGVMLNGCRSEGGS